MSELVKALAEAQAEFGPVVKKSENPHFKSKYADLAAGMEVVRPIIAKHGIAYTQTFEVVDGTLLLRTALRKGAEEISSVLPLTQPPQPQAFVSLTTYYKRVALFSILGITPVGDDDDGNEANETTTTQAPPRQTRQPQRQTPPPPQPKLDTVGLSPQAAVEKAIGAKVTPITRPSEDADPWRLANAPAEDVADTMIAAIQLKPWPEVTAAVKLYADRLTLTDHERGKIREALNVRREDERQQNLLAAG